MERYAAFFGQATENPTPLPYQRKLANDGEFRVLLDVPTGLGKTAAAMLAWVWRRRFGDRPIRAQTPRRLVYCLPMRVLAEQTFSEALKWLARLGLLAGKAEWIDPDANGLPSRHSRLQSYFPVPEGSALTGWAAANGEYGQQPIAVHLLLGGEERTDWALWPERDAILIGTQDMLLSRALNRGYAAGRARWPWEFGLLNNDCLWVFDEIQLMSTGLASSLQLDAWRRSLCLRPTRGEFPKKTDAHLAKPCRSLWMSATMAEHWLDSAVDWSAAKTNEWKDRAKLESDDTDHERIHKLFQIAKPIRPCAARLHGRPKDKSDETGKVSQYIGILANAIRNNASPNGLTLVILNTVERATKLYEELKRGDSAVQTNLIHSRFRPLEREKWNLQTQAGQPRIIISTQVVEAGVDLSAKVLFTELAPWASLIQRFGRCARYPEDVSGTIFWIDLDEHWAKPYEPAELTAPEKLQTLDDVGLRSLKAIRACGDDQKLFPYQPRFVPRDKDLFDLFDTTPDLTGADIDVSRFIRDGEELDVQVFWREVSGTGPHQKDRPDREELCPVVFYRFREALPALRKAGRIWRRNYRKGWELIDVRDTDLVYPGQVFLLEKSCGGYHTIIGWTGDPKHVDFDLPARITAKETITAKEDLQDNKEDRDDLSQLNQWLTIAEHTRHVCKKLEEILRDCDLSESERKILRLAARWHDRGKAHPVFESKIEINDEARQKLGGEPAAKAPDSAWRRNGSRPGFRHELASALAVMETLRKTQPTHAAFAWPDGLDRQDIAAPADAPDALAEELGQLSPEELDLLVYIVAAHHGKVRMSMRSSPDDDRVDVPDPCPDNKRQARGVRDQDELPACRIPSADLKASLVASEITLTLDLMEIGLSDQYGASWRERMQALLERFGPFRLSYLEGLLRAADCRASEDEDKPLVAVAVEA